MYLLLAQNLCLSGIQLFEYYCVVMSASMDSQLSLFMEKLPVESPKGMLVQP